MCSGVPGHGADQGGGGAGGQDDGAAAVQLCEVGDVEDPFLPFLAGAAGPGFAGADGDIGVAVVPDQVREGAEEAFFGDAAP